MKFLATFFLILVTCNDAWAIRKVRICSDRGLWYPFMMTERGEAKGMHIDIIRMAMKNMDVKLEITPLPWSRCLRDAQKGRYDGVATASYKDERAEFLIYPPDAKTAVKSQFRVSQVEYVVVTMADNPYEYDGELKSIPQPVRTPKGYSIAEDLEKEGLFVSSTALGDKQTLQNLLRDNKGSVVTIPNVIQHLSKTPAFSGKLKISKTPIKSKSYFLAFAKQSRLTVDEMNQIWSEIARIREDNAIMTEIAEKY